MPRGDTENAFQVAAAADGIPLIRAHVSWINQRGHYGLPPQATSAMHTLDTIFDALGGIRSEQAEKLLTPLPGDFLHVETGTFIEIDEHQHFTSYRLVTLNLYPHDLEVGFDVNEYRSLCSSWSPKADRYRTGKAATGFGPGGLWVPAQLVILRLSCHGVSGSCEVVTGGCCERGHST